MDHHAGTIELAENTEVIVHQLHHFDLLAHVHVERTDIAGRLGALGNPCLQLFRESIDLFLGTRDILEAAGHTGFLIERHHIG